MELWVVLGILAAAAFWAIAAYNGLVGGLNQVENAWRQIDVQLKRRHDLIPNLVEVAKDSMGYEQETLMKLVEARGRAMAAGSRHEAIAAEGALSAALGRFFALAENYPQLRANEQIGALMEELTSTENRIAFARQHYNDSVMAQNNRVQHFPGNLVAGPFGFGRQEYFAVPEAETQPVKVDLR